MAPVVRLPCKDVLAPEDIRVAASAFESTLTLLDSADQPESARETVARYIIERTLQGERDPIRLRNGALAYLRRPEPLKRA